MRAVHDWHSSHPDSPQQKQTSTTKANKFQRHFLRMPSIPPVAMHPTVEANCNYLNALQQQGHTLTDIEITGGTPPNFYVRVLTASGEEFKFHIQATHEVFMAHHREAVALTGWGPRGLSNVVYAEARMREKQLGLPPSQILIRLSPECRNRMGEHLNTWLIYGFKFIEDQSLSGLRYVIQAHPADFPKGN